VIEPLEEEPSYIEKPMFGAIGCYFNGKLVLALIAGDEPWDGLLVATDHVYHESLQAELPGLIEHPVLRKWLYLSQSAEEFEASAEQLVRLILRGDERLGVEPSERKHTPKSKKRIKKREPARAGSRL
jgi:hypothetical protein